VAHHPRCATHRSAWLWARGVGARNPLRKFSSLLSPGIGGVRHEATAAGSCALGWYLDPVLVSQEIAACDHGVVLINSVQSRHSSERATSNTTQRTTLVTVGTHALLVPTFSRASTVVLCVWDFRVRRVRHWHLRLGTARCQRPLFSVHSPFCK